MDIRKMNKPNEYYIAPRSLVTAKEVCQILRVSNDTLSSLIKEGLFPQPVAVRKRKRFFVYGDVMEFIDNKKNNVDKTYKPIFKENMSYRRDSGHNWDNTLRNHKVRFTHDK